MIKKKQKLIIALVSLPLIAILVSGTWLWLSPFSSVVAANHAKELCSCLFVSQLPQNHCEEYASQYLKTSGHQIDVATKRITSYGLGRSASAKWLSKREGCRLELAHNTSSN